MIGVFLAVAEPAALSFGLLSFRVCAARFRGHLNSDVKATLLGTANTGKTILVTGAGGCIGSALVQTLASSDPRFLILLDHSSSIFTNSSAACRSRQILFTPPFSGIFWTRL